MHRKTNFCVVIVDLDLYSTWNDPIPEMIPEPEMIPKMTKIVPEMIPCPKRSPSSTRNDPQNDPQIILGMDLKWRYRIMEWVIPKY